MVAKREVIRREAPVVWAAALAAVVAGSGGGGGGGFRGGGGGGVPWRRRWRRVSRRRWRRGPTVIEDKSREGQGAKPAALEYGGLEVATTMERKCRRDCGGGSQQVSFSLAEWEDDYEF